MAHLGTPSMAQLKWGQSLGTEPLTSGVCTNSQCRYCLPVSLPKRGLPAGKTMSPAASQPPQGLAPGRRVTEGPAPSISPQSPSHCHQEHPPRPSLGPLTPLSGTDLSPRVSSPFFASDIDFLPPALTSSWNWIS